MRNASRFQKFSAVYACRSCDRNTRATGRGDNENVLMCAECFDLGGNENSLSDSGKLYDSPENILGWIAYIASKGGRVDQWSEIKAVAEKVIADKAKV